jgi:YD repeat-containing protein
MLLACTRRAAAGAALFAVVLCAPGGAAPRDAEADPPAWYLDPPRNDGDWLWGIGQGPTLDDARRAALKSLASGLRVSVSASFDDRTHVRNGEIDKTTMERILEEVQKTEFSNPVLEKAASVHSGAYALMKVDRRAFTRDTSAEFDTAVRLVREATRGVARKRAIEQFTALQSSVPNIRKALALGHLLQAADRGGAVEESAAILADLAALEARALRAASALVFALEFSPPDADVARVVTGFVNSSGTRVTERRDAAGLVIAITTTARQQTFYGSKNVLLQVTLAVRDEERGGVASKQYDVNGSSMSDYGAARQSAMAELAEALRMAGKPGWTFALGF